MRVFENRELRRIFGPKCDEVKSERIKLHSEEVNDLYPSPNIIRVIKSRKTFWAGYIANKREKSCAYRVFVGKPEGKRPLGRRRRKGEDNIKMDLQEVGWGACTELICLRIWTRGGLP